MPSSAHWPTACHETSPVPLTHLLELAPDALFELSITRRRSATPLSRCYSYSRCQSLLSSWNTTFPLLSNCSTYLLDLKAFYSHRDIIHRTRMSAAIKKEEDEEDREVPIPPPAIPQNVRCRKCDGSGISSITTVCEGHYCHAVPMKVWPEAGRCDGTGTIHAPW